MIYFMFVLSLSHGAMDSSVICGCGKSSSFLLALSQGCHSISFSKFHDFSLTFNCFPDPFGRPILVIFIHRQFEFFIQIFILTDLIFR